MSRDPRPADLREQAQAALDRWGTNRGVTPEQQALAGFDLADALRALLAEAPRVEPPPVAENSLPDRLPRGFVPQNRLGQLAREVSQRIDALVNNQPYADVESNVVEQVIYAALEQVARVESPLAAAVERTCEYCGTRYEAAAAQVIRAHPCVGRLLATLPKEPPVPAAGEEP